MSGKQESKPWSTTITICQELTDGIGINVTIECDDPRSDQLTIRFGGAFDDCIYHDIIEFIQGSLVAEGIATNNDGLRGGASQHCVFTALTSVDYGDYLMYKCVEQALNKGQKDHFPDSALGDRFPRSDNTAKDALYSASRDPSDFLPLPHVERSGDEAREAPVQVDRELVTRYREVLSRAWGRSAAELFGGAERIPSHLRDVDAFLLLRSNLLNAAAPVAAEHHTALDIPTHEDIPRTMTQLRRSLAIALREPLNAAGVGDDNLRHDLVERAAQAIGTFHHHPDSVVSATEIRRLTDVSGIL